MSASTSASNGSSDTTPRVGFIGAGWTERVQIPAFQLGGLQPQAICSGRQENAARAAQKLGIPSVYARWQDLLQADDIDLVSIVTPPHLHAEIAIAALRAGKHVICEKPTALTVAEAENMFAAAQAAPQQLAIIDHELRFHPQRAHLRQLIRSGHIGNPLYIELDWRYAVRLDPNHPWTWHSDVDKGGGYLGALGSHLIDLARWLFGSVDAVSAQLQTAHFLRREQHSEALRRVTSDDAAHLMIQFNAGLQGRISVTALYPDNVGMSVLVVGTEGALRVDQNDRLWSKCGDEFPQEDWREIEVPVHEEDAGPIAKLPNSRAFTLGSYYLAKAIAESFATQEQPKLTDAASFYDGLVVQRVLDAAQRSNRNRAWVRL